MLEERGWRIVRRSDTKDLSIAEIHVSERSLANAHRVREYGLEDRRQLPGRRRDDLQHLRCRRLLLKHLGEVPPRLGELARACLKLQLELARVRLELLFRRSLRFLRRVKMTHAGHPQAEDPPIRKHTTPGPLLCETVRGAGP